MSDLPRPWPNPEVENQRYYTCSLCGTAHYEAEIQFTSGSVAPTVGETLTGATSTDTGVVAVVDLISGSYAGGDAAGYITMTSPTGYDSVQGTVFSDTETVNGSTGGTNILTVNHDGILKQYGTFYAEGDMVEKDGKRYCRWHYQWRYPKDALLEYPVDVEEERG